MRRRIPPHRGIMSSRDLLLIALLVIFATGCGFADGTHKLLPPARNFTISERDPLDIEDAEASRIPVYRQGQKIPQGCIRIASLGAHGNGYANHQQLEKALQEEAALVGGDFVIASEMNVSRDETIGVYGGGVMI